MFRRSLSALSDQNTTPVIQRKLNHFVSQLNQKRAIVEDRYTRSFGAETSGVALLRQLLALVDVPALMKNYNTDFERVSELMRMRPTVTRWFNTVVSGIVRDSLFIAPRGSVRAIEILIPSEVDSPFNGGYPLGKGWDAWRKIRPVRLIDINTNELSFNVYKDRITFARDAPTRAIFSIDVVALVLQYINYLEVRDLSPDDVFIETAVSYLHRNVLYSGILEDLENIWLRNQYIKVLAAGGVVDDLNKELSASIGHNIYGFYGQTYIQAMEELNTLVLRSKNGVMPPLRIIHSLPMSRGYVPDYYANLKSQTNIEGESLRQNVWVVYLRDLSWLKLVYHSYRLNPEYVGYNNLIVNFERDLDLVIKSRFWNTIHDSRLRRDIEQEIRDLVLWVGKESMLEQLSGGCQE